jgi:hypothetical protein
MIRSTLLSASAAIALALLPVSAHAQLIYQGPGVYSASPSQSYGPNGTPSATGTDTYTRSGRNGTTYSTNGDQTFGSNGTRYTTRGNTTYGNNGSVSQTYGNQTYIRMPNGQLRTCTTFGNQAYCN